MSLFKILKKRNIEGYSSGINGEDDPSGYIPVFGDTASELLSASGGDLSAGSSSLFSPDNSNVAKASNRETMATMATMAKQPLMGSNNTLENNNRSALSKNAPLSSSLMSSQQQCLENAIIYYYDENRERVNHIINGSRTTIGRRATNDIAFPTKNKISKEHAIIEQRVSDKGKKSYYIQDLKSSNGVFLNRNRIESPQPLRHGDFIELGTEVRLFFVIEEDSMANNDNSESNKPESMNSISGNSNYASNNNAFHNSLRSNRPLSTGSRRWSHRSSGSMRRPLEDYASYRPSRLSVFRRSRVEKTMRDMVTVLPASDMDKDKIKIHAEMTAWGKRDDQDFYPAAEIKNLDVLTSDYEKLRLAYELSKYSISEDLDSLLQKLLDLVFSVLPSIERGIVLLVDKGKSSLVVNGLKIRESVKNDKIVVAMTILNLVIHRKTCLITADTLQQESSFPQNSQKVTRSVISVPLISHEKIVGILHLDSMQAIESFKEKDLSLIRTLAHQAAISIENSSLLEEIETELRIVDQLGRFLPPQVVDKVVQREELISQEGREIVGTVLFADIRGFTNMSESTSPQELVNLLNEYFERLVSVVFKWDGVLDKYIGDALMAVFGTLEDEVDPVYKSVGAALGIRDAIREMNEDRKAAGKAPIGVGVGLNTGTLVAGFIGCNQRLEYTCIGDTVNTSSRICGIARSDQVLISQSTLESIKDRISSRYVDKFIFKGKQQEVAVYEALEIL